jgi:hypothetical protein
MNKIENYVVKTKSLGVMAIFLAFCSLFFVGLPTVVDAVGPGGVCTLSSECTDGYCSNPDVGCFCFISSGEASGVCEGKREERGSCTEAGQCRTDLRCDVRERMCVTGTEVTLAPPGSSLNTCIVGNVTIPNVETLQACCELGSTNSVPPATVNFSGTVQNCQAAATQAPATPSTTAIRLFNPLGHEVDIPAFLGRGIRGVLGVIGAVALLMFVYGGIVWMTAGDSKRVDDAKNIIKNSVIGLLLIFFSYNLIGIFFDFFT